MARIDLTGAGRWPAALPFLALALALAGCVAAPTSEFIVHPEGERFDPPDLPVPVSPVASEENDCLIAETVIREHYRFGPDHPAPPVRVGPDWTARCDWAALGLRAIPADAPRGDNLHWLSFERPTYASSSVTIRSGVMYGSRNGEDVECILQPRERWVIVTCSRTWAS